MKNLIKKPVIIVSIVAIVVVVAGYFYFSGSKKPNYEFAIAKRADIVQEVSVTGRVKPAENVDLAFEKGGRVARVYVRVGDKVKSGDLLIALENSDLQAQLNQAQAVLKEQQTKLKELKAGARLEEIELKKAAVEKAKQDVRNEYSGVADVLNDAYLKAEEAINVKIDSFFDYEDTDNPYLTFSTSDPQLETMARSLRVTVKNNLKTWKEELNQIKDIQPIEFVKLDEAINHAKSYLATCRDLLTYLSDALEKSINLSATTRDSYRSSLNVARNSINTAISSVEAKQQKIAAQLAALNIPSEELALLSAGPTAEQIAAQEARVEQALANVKNYQAQLDKTILKSPIDGVVTKQEAKVGEIINAGINVVSVMSANKFEIEANVPEADIAKIKVGNPAKVTLDAYGEDVVFEAKVIKIDPAEVMIEGVATYKTTLQFNQEDKRIKSGMTANIDILTDKRENVIVVPKRAVMNKNGDKIVKVLVGNNVSEVKVKTGLTGSEGEIEIIEGIKEGDKIIVSQKEK